MLTCNRLYCKPVPTIWLRSLRNFSRLLVYFRASLSWRAMACLVVSAIVCVCVCVNGAGADRVGRAFYSFGTLGKLC